MNKLTARPTKRNCLARLSASVPFSGIVDVGVNTSTPELIEVFPKLVHFLFEPVTLFHDAIAKNYKHVQHILSPVALSNKSGTLYLTISSVSHDGVATHSQLSTKKVSVDGQNILASEKVEVSRYDEIDVGAGRNYLLKVDVDGKDLEVLQGFGDQLSDAGAIIIEATFNTLADRLSYCIRHGFQLFDIVDLVYYGPSLYQCDLVLVRADLATSEVRPSIREFDPTIWSPFH